MDFRCNRSEAEEIGRQYACLLPKRMEGLQYGHKRYRGNVVSACYNLAHEGIDFGHRRCRKAAAHVLRSWEIWPTFCISESVERGYAASHADLDNRVIQEFLLIINASPVGQWPDVEQRPLIPYEAMGKDSANDCLIWCIILLRRPF